MFSGIIWRMRTTDHRLTTLPSWSILNRVNQNESERDNPDILYNSQGVGATLSQIGESRLEPRVDFFDNEVNLEILEKNIKFTLGPDKVLDKTKGSDFKL